MMVTSPLSGKKLITTLLVGSVLALQSGCYFFRKHKSQSDGGAGTGVIGQPIGQRAGGMNEASLASLYAIGTDHAPAAVRPDPDVVVRQLLLQYREEGAVVAREIGRVENFRLLLGGASQDFSKPAQETYDATSLLAELKVAEEVCEGLVAPTPWRHPGWNTILPAAASDVTTNLKFLTQRILGVPTASIDDADIANLTAIMDTAKVDGAYANESYIPACATLLIDAEALLL